jgi:hypothetical protein
MHFGTIHALDVRCPRKPTTSLPVRTTVWGRGNDADSAGESLLGIRRRRGAACLQPQPQRAQPLQPGGQPRDSPAQTPLILFARTTSTSPVPLPLHQKDWTGHHSALQSRAPARDVACYGVRGVAGRDDCDGAGALSRHDEAGDRPAEKPSQGE